LLVSLAVLAIPFIDLLLAVIRRVSHGRSPFAPDKRHLHHRLLGLGHTHRRAVLLMYFWAALLAFGVTGFSIVSGPAALLPVLAGGAILGLLLLVVPSIVRKWPRPARREAPIPPPAEPVRPPARLP
jgi:UDP-GlcNAc:undecaprenyl-phosphate GlcNAc-1-phosphate transferase